MATAVREHLPVARPERVINPLLLRAWAVPRRLKSLWHPFAFSAALGIAIAAAFDHTARHFDPMRWPLGLIGIGLLATWWPAWRALVVCLRHRQRETWVHWLMTPLTPQQLLHGLWLDALAPALVMLAVAWPLMALSWQRNSVALGWVLQPIMPPFAQTPGAMSVLLFGLTLGLILLGSTMNTLVAVVIALRFRGVAVSFTALLVMLGGVFPGVLIGLDWLWNQSGWPPLPRPEWATMFGWRNVVCVAGLHWFLKAALCVVLHVLAVRRFQSWVLNDR